MGIRWFNAQRQFIIRPPVLEKVPKENLHTLTSKDPHLAVSSYYLSLLFIRYCLDSLILVKNVNSKMSVFN